MDRSWNTGSLGRGMPLAATLFLFLVTAGCDGSSEGAGNGANGAGEPDASAAPPPASASLPVSPNTGPVEALLADQGESAFQARGCVACHTVGRGRLVGPDLAGVTERRSFEWFYHMVTNPDSMTRADPVARELLAKYLTPMLDQGAAPEEVRAIWEYLRRSWEEGVRPQENP